MKKIIYTLVASATTLLPASNLMAQAVAPQSYQKIIADANGVFSVAPDTTKANATATPESLQTFSPYAPKTAVYNAPQSMLRVALEKEPVKDHNGKATGEEKFKWFFEIPDSLIGRPMMLITRISQSAKGSPFTPHEQTGSGMYTFCVSPDQKFLQLKKNSNAMLCDTIYNISRAVDISNSEPIVNVFKVDKHAKGVYRIDVTSFLMDDRIMSLSSEYKNNLRISAMDPARSEISSVHTYQSNVEIQTHRTYNTSSTTIASPCGFMTLTLNASFVLLPKDLMQRRLGDPRVGYSYVSTPSFSDNQQNVDNLRFVKRWRLETKGAADATLQQGGTPVEPKKPIVYHIDPAFPAQWVSYVKKGVAEWQKAFEKAGWKNAIYATEWHQNDSTLSLEDSRYNVIRYLPSYKSTVAGNTTIDARSGEIINASVYFHAGALQQMRANYVGYCGALDPECHGITFSEELMGALIQHAIARAIAPTLGLTPNLLASTKTPTDSLRSESYLQQYGISPSITDQLPYNYVAQPADNVSRANLIPRVGDADEWTIEWGYKPLPYTDQEQERQYLVDYTTDHLAQNPRHEFANLAADPFCKSNDLGNDQPKAIEYGLRNLKLIAPHLVEWGATSRDHHYGSANARNYFYQIDTQLSDYLTILANNITGTCMRPKPAVAQGPVFCEPDKEYINKCVDAIFEVFGQQATWINADKTQRLSWELPERTGIEYAQNIVGPSFVSMMQSLNPALDPMEFAQRFYDFCFKDVRPGVAADLFGRTLQSQFVHSLIDRLKQSGNGSMATYEAPIYRHFLKQAQQRIKTASASTTDATMRAHYSMLSNQLEEYFTIK